MVPGRTVGSQVCEIQGVQCRSKAEKKIVELRTAAGGADVAPRLPKSDAVGPSIVLITSTKGGCKGRPTG